MEEAEIQLTPKHFLRCHSRHKTDSADIQTQVWLCSFEPSVSGSGKTTPIVATCGGNSVCFINVKTGKVVKKFYSPDNREIFLSLSWATIDNQFNYLVAAGSTKTLYFINAEGGFCFHEEKIAKQIGSLKPDVGVTSLLFHPKLTNILYCSASNGRILAFDVGQPSQNFDDINVNLLHSWKVDCEVLTLIYHLPDELLMATSDDGIHCFFAQPSELAGGDEQVLTRVLIQFPGHALFLTESPSLVDSVEILEDGLIASKCALRGAIYVWDINSWKHAIKENNTTLRVVPLYELIWSDTDNYFMYMGYDRKSKILACGDDKGALWIYNIRSIIEGGRKGESTPAIKITPTAVYKWPKLNDYFSNRKRKLLDAYDIVVNKIALSYNCNHLVAVTSNNMVCIWKKIKEKKADSTIDSE